MASGTPVEHAGGPEGVNPFWSDPADKGKNMEALEDQIEAYEKVMPEQYQLLFALAKSDNRNSAVFVLDTSKSVSDEDCILTFWLVNEPAHRAATLQKRGETENGQPIVIPVNSLEKMYLGCRVNDEGGKPMISIAAFDEANLNVLPEFELVRSAGQFWVRTMSLGDNAARVDRAYVQMCKGATRRVDNLTIYGTTMDDEDVSGVFTNEEVA